MQDRISQTITLSASGSEYSAGETPFQIWRKSFTFVIDWRQTLGCSATHPEVGVGAAQ
jgi:hypothetical protein